MKRLIITVCGLCFTAFGGFAADRYVSLNGTNNYPFTNWPDAATNIEWAVNAGANGDTVWISNGTYVLTNQVTVLSNLTIRGIGGMPIISGNGANRCFYLAPNNNEYANTNNCTLSNLFITGGYSTNNGGGVYIQSGARVLYCVFSNNVSTTNGGGLYLNRGYFTNDHCTFVANTAANGGGVYFYAPDYAAPYGNLINDCVFYTNTATSSCGGMYIYNANYRIVLISNCTFICNSGPSVIPSSSILTACTIASNAGFGISVTRGGCIISNCYVSNNSQGIYIGVGSTVRNSTIARNSTSTDGAGIYCNVNDCQFLYCIIEGNSGRWGGGFYMYNNSGTIRNCLFRNNIASQTGGGVYNNNNSSGKLINFSACTIVSNYAASGGGGIHDVSTSTASTNHYDNCIIYFNTAGTANSNYYCGATCVSSFTNCCLSPSLSGTVTNYSVNNITNDPQFIEKASGNYRLQNSSPCLNAGANQAWMSDTVDLDGCRRIDRMVGIVDMGCYEYLPSGSMYYIGIRP
jgi:hypothetical protein